MDGEKFFQKTKTITDPSAYGVEAVVPTSQKPRLKALIGLKNSARELFRYQTTETSGIAEKIKSLSKEYDKFVSKHGFLHKKENVYLL
jgi:hypothetical protein